MLPYFWYMLKVIICSGILFAYYWLFLRNKIFHSYNRFYLLVSMLLSLLLPLLKINFWQPASSQNQAIRVLQAVSVGDGYVSNVAVTTHQNNWSFDQLFILVYWPVSIIFFLVLLRTLLLIRTLLKRYPLQQIEQVSFVNTQHNSTPFSFLQYIFWNASIDINTTTGRQIFKHEVAHIQEKHTHDKLFVNITLIFCWFNPFFWLYRKELNMIHEFIADKKAVEDCDTAAFAAMILQAAYPRHRFDLVNNFFYSPIKRRLIMLSKNKNPKVNYTGRIMVLPLVMFVFTAFAFKIKTVNTKQNNYGSIRNKLIEYTDTITVSMHSMYVNVKHADSSYLKTDEFKTKALVIVDSKEMGNMGNNYIEKKREKYSTMVVYNPLEARKIYGDKGRYGIIKLTLKQASFSTVTADSIFFDKNSKTIKMSGKNTALKGDFSDALIYVDGKEVSPAELIAISPGKISSVNILEGKKLDDIIEAKGKKSVINVSLKPDDLAEVVVRAYRSNKETPVDGKPNAEPKIYLGNNGGGIINLDYLKSVKEINLSDGYTFVSCVIWIKGPGFDKNVVQVTLNSKLLSSLSEYFNRCKDGAQIFFDNVQVKDKKGVQQTLPAPPDFKVYEKNTEIAKLP